MVDTLKKLIIPKSEYNNIVKMYINGMSLKEIANLYKLKQYNTIKIILNRKKSKNKDYFRSQQSSLSTTSRT